MWEPYTHTHVTGTDPHLKVIHYSCVSFFKYIQLNVKNYTKWTSHCELLLRFMSYGWRYSNCPSPPALKLVLCDEWPTKTADGHFSPWCHEHLKTTHLPVILGLLMYMCVCISLSLDVLTSHRGYFCLIPFKIAHMQDTSIRIFFFCWPSRKYFDWPHHTHKK